MGLLFSVLTVTLRANQNVVGLAMTTFGVGFGNFFGGSIIKLSRALGQRVGTFMDDQFQPDPIIVRKDERVEETSNKAADGQYHYFPLGRGKTDRHMEPMFIRIMPDVAHTTSSHEGEEFIIVVSGKILVKYGKEETIIEEGDSAYFNAVVPHYIGAVDGPAEIYAVLYTPF